MGAICSKGSAVDFSASHIKINVGCKDDARVSSPSKLKSYGNSKALLVGGVPEKRSLEQSFSFSEGMSPNFGRIRNGTPAPRHHALSRVLSEKSWSTKWKGSYAGKSGTQKASSSRHILYFYLLTRINFTSSVMTDGIYTGIPCFSIVIFEKRRWCCNKQLWHHLSKIFIFIFICKLCSKESDFPADLVYYPASPC